MRKKSREKREDANNSWADVEKAETNSLFLCRFDFLTFIKLFNLSLICLERQQRSTCENSLVGGWTSGGRFWWVPVVLLSEIREPRSATPSCSCTMISTPTQ